MKYSILLLLLSSTMYFGQQKVDKLKPLSSRDYVKSIPTLTLNAAIEMAERARTSASKLGKKVAIAVLDASGNTVLIMKDETVGPHNTEAARKKAFTSLSTKTATLQLLRNADSKADTRNLNTIPELLLLGGGTPIYFEGEIIGSVGIAGGGSPENDDAIAKSASIPEVGITTDNQLTK